MVCVSGRHQLGAGVSAPTRLAQTESAELFYRVDGEPIPLQLQADAIAVVFTEPPAARGHPPIPLYRRLQADLQGTRGDAVTVHPVGTDYAIVTLPRGSRSSRSTLIERVQRPYVDAILPVLSCCDRNEQILLPNEIIVSFEPDTTPAQRQVILAAQGLTAIRPLQFSDDRVLARLIELDHDTAVLTATERLHATTGVRSATPNFIQVRAPLEPPMQPPLSPSPAQFAARSRRPANLRTLAWYLDSTRLHPNLENRGVKAPAAWTLGSRGEGITVAVLDTFTQWDHPALQTNTYELPAPCPSAWPEKLAAGTLSTMTPIPASKPTSWPFCGPPFRARLLCPMQPCWRSMTPGSPGSDRTIQRQQMPRLPPIFADQIQAQVVNEFHGTQVAGVIAAHGQSDTAFTGVAPAARILPVRIGDISSGPMLAASVEAIAYAAERGADVINMSWGMLPATEIAAVITQALEDNPDLVIVASSGNFGDGEVSFPASLPAVVAVGASTLNGHRAPYSSFGPGLTLVAPGGVIQSHPTSGILTTGGTVTPGFWQGMPLPTQPWSWTQDPQGTYIWTQGTSFSSPIVAGIVALMQSADQDRSLSRDRIVELLTAAASHGPLTLTDEERDRYQTLATQTNTPATAPALTYFFGSGLVDAAEAVRLVQATD
ncbi:peptidase S8 [Halomicronema hongdechloris C2206]|uniref:Peptidase S8 n=1 Tax=Halomicronema hongdechloris C2206 TaxID=1641165 RepID=A0A1Z3HRX5_9CYAN|nr:S8 family serine peptidase [Halomicronema hongdechloris]ASC73064.1 peptidase S8 [Halomicronema hongdechloris C2206]